MRYCSWCDQPIEGEAQLLGDDAASGAHPAAFWHENPAECGRRRRLLPGPDSTIVPLLAR